MCPLQLGSDRRHSATNGRAAPIEMFRHARERRHRLAFDDL
jgi:hypothetical protein